MLKIRAGVIAKTVSLPNGLDESALAPDVETVVLFGSSDLLEIKSDVYAFDAEPSDVGRTVNWYFAAELERLYGSDEPQLFRALSFLRLQRPQYTRLGLSEWERILKEFRRICAKEQVACRVLLGYGWADLYLDFSSPALWRLFTAIIACRAVTLTKDAALFRNAFTIVGVDRRRESEASKTKERVRPSIALRAAPSNLGRVLREDVTQIFPSRLWAARITSGKRDIVVMPQRDDVEFAEFWKAHRRLRNRLRDRQFPVHKIETHFDFDRSIIKSFEPAVASASVCQCETEGSQLKDAFVDGVNTCNRISDGLKKSFIGLAQLYREALLDRESCCDFDAAAAHFYAQRTVFTEHEKLCDEAEAIEGSHSSEALAIFRLRDLLRDALNELDISSGVIFHQEQNGSYADLLSRSERVPLYRGGMQKINAVLLAAIEQLIARYDLPISPMLCWWPAGHIQSVRPIGVIKVPVFFLHQPEAAVFLIVHELGQLTAYEMIRAGTLGLPKIRIRIEPRQEWQLSTFDRHFMESLGISPGTAIEEIPLIDFLERLEELGSDTGKLLTDVFADVFLLRVGFNDDVRGLRNFIFDQLMNLESMARPMSHAGYAHATSFVARVISVTIAALMFGRPDAPSKTPKVVNEELIDAATNATLQFFDAVETSPRFTALLGQQPELLRLLRNEETISRARGLVFRMWRWEWLDIVMNKIRTFSRDGNVPLPGGDDVWSGTLAEIDPERIVAYFRPILGASPATAEDRQGLFRARTALLSSVLASSPCVPRLRAG